MSSLATGGRHDDLGPDMIATIDRDHLVSTPLRPADLLFVFGTRRGIPQFIDVISDLWSRRLFKMAIVTGGETAGQTFSEATILASAMCEIGIPASIILTEHRAANTGENVTFSMPIIEAHIGLSNVGSLIAVGKFHASVRYLMTLQRHWPDVDKMFAPVHVFAQVQRWHEHAELRAKILEERRKVQLYLELGYIDHWPGERNSPPALAFANPC